MLIPSLKKVADRHGLHVIAGFLATPAMDFTFFDRFSNPAAFVFKFPTPFMTIEKRCFHLHSITSFS